MTGRGDGETERRREELGYRFAQIGVGEPHASGFRETLRLVDGAELVAAFGRDRAVAEAELAAESGKVRLYDDVETLLREEKPDAVMISLPPVETAATIALAAGYGCHILAEKPCARTAAEFRPALAAIEQSGVAFATGYMRHLSPAALAIKEILAQGMLGELISAEANFLTASVKRRNPDHWLFKRDMCGGGILHWLGCHWLDLFRFVTGAEVTEVAAILETRSGEAIEVEDVATVSLRYSNGMLGSVHCAYVLDASPDQVSIRVSGRLGWLTWDGVGPEVRVRSTHPAWATAPTRTLRFEADEVPGYGGAMGLLAMQRFVASFTDRSQAAFSPLDALRILEVLDAANESSRGGRRVAVAAGASEPRD